MRAPLPTRYLGDIGQAVVVDEREQTILELYPLVRVIALRLARRLPASVEVDELVNIGVVGLIHALERYDASRGVPLKAFVEIRIQGSMLDFLRGFDNQSRQDRALGRRLDQARARLRQQLGREPTRLETAATLDLTPAALDQLLGRLGLGPDISLDSPPPGDAASTLREQLPADDPTAEEVWIEGEHQEALRAAIRGLPEKERRVVEDIYFRGRPLREIGRDLGVTESRVSQLRSQAMARMQDVLRRTGALPRPRGDGAPTTE